MSSIDLFIFTNICVFLGNLLNCCISAACCVTLMGWFFPPVGGWKASSVALSRRDPIVVVALGESHLNKKDAGPHSGSRLWI